MSFSTEQLREAIRDNIVINTLSRDGTQIILLFLGGEVNS